MYESFLLICDESREQDEAHLGEMEECTGDKKNETQQEQDRVSVRAWETWRRNGASCKDQNRQQVYESEPGVSFSI